MVLLKKRKKQCLQVVFDIHYHLYKKKKNIIIDVSHTCLQIYVYCNIQQRKKKHNDIHDK